MSEGMDIPMEFSTRGLTQKQASFSRTCAEAWIDKLESRGRALTACRVAVERSGDERADATNPVRVRVEVSMPPSPRLVAVRPAEEGVAGEPLRPAIDGAFRRMLTQLDTVQDKLKEH